MVGEDRIRGFVTDPRHRRVEAASAPVETARPHELDAARILASIGEVPYEWKIDSDVLIWGANVASVLKLSRAGAVETGRQFAALLDPNNKETRFDAVMQSAQRDDGKGVPYQICYNLRVSDDDRSKPLWIEDTGRWFGGMDARPQRAHGVIRVITERHVHEERLAYLSRFDALTGEMNRWHLTEVLRETLEETERQQNGSCAFIIVSVDNLDRVNDAYGFEIADEVVAAIGQRLRAAMRARDSIGRFSGNKFGMILRSCTPEDMAIAADRFCAAVRENAVPTNAGLVAVTTTIGGVTAPRHARTLQEVVTRAQESVYFARAKRLGSFHAYHPSIEREAQRRESVKATDEIVTALNERRIVLAYEPVVETKSRRPGFYECLMRVRCADGGIIAANEIIPVAERLGLVRLIDHRMAELVVAELATIPDLRVSLNVSPASTIDPDWWTSLAAQLRSNPGIGERLTLEITEMAAIQDVEDTRGFVNRVKDLGCRLAIDDFGAGHTSFRNLRRLGVDMIKIDGAFVQNLTRSADDRAFVQAMLSLGRSLGLATVAEWVQDEAAAALLSEWNCDYLQGDLVGHASIERPQTGGAVNGVSSR